MLQSKYDENESETDNDYANFGSWSNQGAYADIDLDDTGVPALDGYRWKIQNVQTSQFMDVVNSSTADGALIRSFRNTPLLNQMWNIVRTRNGYYELFNANSGRTAEVANVSLADGASVRQWGTADNQTQHWYIEPAGDGSFYIRNGNSNKYLTSNSTNCMQYDLTGSVLQKWRFVPANPTDGPSALYRFQGNVNDGAGTNHGVAFGSPAFGPGPTGAPNSVIQLDGLNDYVQLPSGVASSENITVAAWVYWNGGDVWQRIFDFGNDTTSYMFLTPRSGDDTMRFAITDGSNTAEQILDTEVLPANEWVHLAVTLGGNTGVLYVNGVPQVAGQILLDPADINSVNNYIGKSQWPDPLFDGMIDDLRIYDYALDQTQIANLVHNADFDHDGDVDNDDLEVWEAAYGMNALADADGNGDSDGDDYLVWQRTCGSSAPVIAPTAVPEPASIVLAGLCLVAMGAVCSHPRRMSVTHT